MNNDIKEVKPLDSFKAVYAVLAFSGFYKPLNKPTNMYKSKLHQIYRFVAFLITVSYNMQHLIFVVLNRHDLDKIMGSLVIEIPQFNMLVKFITINLQTSRIDKIHEQLKGPIFAVNNEKDKAIIQKNKQEMRQLVIIIISVVTSSIVLWPCALFASRYYDENEAIPAHMPFKTDTWLTFSFSVFFECAPVLWIGYGHISVDILVATYYSHVQTQLIIIKAHLQDLLNNENEKHDDRMYLKRKFQYKDLLDETVAERFIEIIIRYDKIVWLKNQVDTVFNVSLTVQFLSSAILGCVAIYKMSLISMSFDFLFLVFLMIMFLTQLFLYCFYGNLVEFENHSINDVLYQCDWLSLSPSFRKSLVIAMCRWSKRISPTVCKLIPLSLTTFVSIARMSYSLYTVLQAAHQP